MRYILLIIFCILGIMQSRIYTEIVKCTSQMEGYPHIAWGPPYNTSEKMYSGHAVVPLGVLECGPDTMYKYPCKSQYFNGDYVPLQRINDLNKHHLDETGK